MIRTGIPLKNWFIARRRHPSAGYVVVVLALALVGIGYATLAPHDHKAQADSTPASKQEIARGKQQFDVSCASCHGMNGEGTDSAPSLIGVGAAAVDFQVSTGRMPAANPGVQQERRKPRMNPTQTRELAAYVASLGGGPSIPAKSQYAPASGDVKIGGRLFMANCAQCHNFAGSGGALTGGKRAPSLNKATAKQIYEAMLTGPEAMPKFNDSTITPADKRAISHYVVQTRSEPNEGGSSLGRVGPVTEGIVGWLAGIGICVGAALWITVKRRGNE